MDYDRLRDLPPHEGPPKPEQPEEPEAPQQPRKDVVCAWLNWLAHSDSEFAPRAVVLEVELVKLLCDFFKDTIHGMVNGNSDE